MTTAIPAITRSNNTTLQTHRAPRTKSFAARPEIATTTTISPAAQAALTAATVPPDATTPPAATAPAAPRTPVEKAYRNPAG